MPREDKKKPAVNVSAVVFVSLVLLSFLFLFFSARSFIVDFKDTGLVVFSGIRNGMHTLGSFFSGTVLSIKELADLKKEYAELLAHVERYEQMGRSAVDIMQENQRLREQLSFSETLNYKHIAAEIVGRDPDNLYQALVINKGRRAGVKDNMPVIAYQNGVQGLVGKISEAAEFESFVVPVYEINSFVPARVASSRYEGIVGGQGKPDAPLLMRFIQKSAGTELSYGDGILTSGMGRIYPAGISIGSISLVREQDYELSISIELEHTIDFSRLEHVFVVSVESEGSLDGAADGSPDGELQDGVIKDVDGVKKVLDEGAR
jgi:rod shape-determining protein MreC